MEQELMEAAQAGDISELYRLIRQDPNVLELFDGIPFVDTPLHAAASAGNTPFAIEIARLKPSFGRKLNQDGLSPIHLALECEHDQTVRKLISLDRELICVQGKEGITPLHYVTERQNLDLLATFLFNCPTSIEKLTIRGETAVHIAVKNQRFGAFEILLAWLHGWADMEEILELKDDEGNTVLHIAAKTNQHQVVELLVDKVNINARNSDGWTARDILLQLSSQQNTTSQPIKFSDVGCDIPELKGDNFKMWKERVLLHLGWIDIDYAIRKDEPPAVTNTNTEAEIALYEHWERSNRLSVMFIKTKISAGIRGSVDQHTKVRDLLKAIDEQFVTSDKAFASTLIMKFCSTRLDTSERCA
ncbi:hypothetical protein F0562_007909 [Nyssa sinensis]|uniref:Uncharacterized protein n=1 Tax=Nyssa sinensis TaxID=561372 RepID=A0A5J5A9K8_9ASTE|nr:hypothetical protein F0562_007909 [Nyssa sinensis]